MAADAFSLLAGSLYMLVASCDCVSLVNRDMYLGLPRYWEVGCSTFSVSPVC